jgi:hypothetical protein
MSKISENTKNILIWSKKNKKKLIFFKNTFEMQKQTRLLKLFQTSINLTLYSKTNTQTLKSQDIEHNLHI